MVPLRILPQMMELLRRIPLAPLRYTLPVAALSPPRIRKMAPPAFLAAVAHALAIGPDRDPRSVDPQGPPN